MGVDTNREKEAVQKGRRVWMIQMQKNNYKKPNKKTPTKDALATVSTLGKAS